MSVTIKPISSMCPSMIIAWLKLRKRNLGPILDANGWAVNAKARLNVPFGAALTQVAELPPGSTIASDDRFGDRPSVWPKFLLVLVIIGFILSLMNQFYLLDLIAFRSTGKHYEIFRQPKKEAPATTGTTNGVSVGVTVTNAPAVQ